jgi:3-oxoacyl-[acyl-carrier protein] reductase
MSVPIDLTGHTALVSGGTRNIGRTIATQLAHAGANVAVIGHRDREALDDTVAALRETGAKAAGALVDVADWAALGEAHQDLESELGRFDIVVNNVGIRPPVPLADVTAENWDRVFSVNVRAAFRCIQLTLPMMMAGGWGRIVNISGLDAVAGSYGRIHVTASKGALLGLTAAVAPGCARHGVTVNSLVPGTTRTHRHTPEWYPDLTVQEQSAESRILIGRPAEVAEIANVALFLVSPLASYLTGQTVYAGGGFPLVRRAEREAAFPIDFPGTE